jgi:hypothetical protein
VAKSKQQEKPIPVVGNVTVTPDGNFTAEVVGEIRTIEVPPPTEDDTAEMVVPSASELEALRLERDALRAHLESATVTHERLQSEAESLKAKLAEHERAADDGGRYIRDLHGKLDAAGAGKPPVPESVAAVLPEEPVARDHGFGKWLVHVPAHCAPREVEAATAAEAVEKYKQQMGIVSLPAAPVAEAVSHPQLPTPTLTVLTPAE